MFKAYQPPAPEKEDWIDGLLNKGLPLAAAGLAGLAAVPTGGMSLAAIPAVLGGAATGYGVGKTVSGLLSDKPNAGAEMERGIGMAAQGASVLNQVDPETGAFKTKTYGSPQTGENKTGLDTAKEKAKTAWYNSPYAGRSA